MTLLAASVGEPDHIRGPEDAPVTLVEYGDYECIPCGPAQPIVAQIERQLDGRLRFVFRHFPLVNLHPHAALAAQAVEAAGAQGRFWEMHDLLSQRQRALETEYLRQYAAWAGLDVARFTEEMEAHAHAGRILKDIESGEQSGVRSTPTFFINGVRHDGSWNLYTLLDAVQKAALSR
jgi:protein-disulfide isomerase